MIPKPSAVLAGEYEAFKGRMSLREQWFIEACLLYGDDDLDAPLLHLAYQTAMATRARAALAGRRDCRDEWDWAYILGLPRPPDDIERALRGL